MENMSSRSPNYQDIDKLSGHGIAGYGKIIPNITANSVF